MLGEVFCCMTPQDCNRYPLNRHLNDLTILVHSHITDVIHSRMSRITGANFRMFRVNYMLHCMLENEHFAEIGLGKDDTI